jgi:hypothetical protein
MGMTDPSGIRTRAEWTAALQALRDHAGVSYDVLVERCRKSSSMSKSTLQQMVMGSSFPRASTVRLFVQACGVDDARPWVDARNRVAKTDVALKRPRTPPGRQVRIGAVPRPADCFQDREVADLLEGAAEDGGTVVLTQVLGGTGGVGKTQLAAAYARRAWAEGVGVLVWANAATRDGVVSAYADAALALGLLLADRDEPEKSAQAFLAWAETTADRWWLVVLDDVRSPADMAGWWPPSAESAADGQVLVTTRLRAAALAGDGRQTVQVGTFTESEARAYLHAKLGDRATDPAVADALADDLGCLPLALAQAAAYITNEDIGVQRYRDLLATRLLHEVVPEEGDLTDDHQRIISATWELSIDQADAARPAGLARPVLQLASMLDPAGIPQAVLSSPPALDHLATYLPEQGHVMDEATVDAVLRVLHRYSLIDHDRSLTYREVRVHQLVQRATRENLNAQAGLGPDLYAALANTVADALLDLWPEIEQDEFGQVLRANTAALHDSADTALWHQDDGAHRVLFRAANSLADTGQVTAARAAYTDLAATAHDRLRPDHHHTLVACAKLAGLRGEAGDAAGAAAATEELLTDYLRVLGPDHPDTLAARGNLALWRGDAGDAAGAAAAYQDLLTDYLRVLGPDHPHTLAASSNLAGWRGEAGDAAGAAAAYQDLLTDYLRVLGPDHLLTLTARNNLAGWRGEAGDAAGAAAATEELLTARLRVLGTDHPDTLAARNNLAGWREQAGLE